MTENRDERVVARVTKDEKEDWGVLCTKIDPDASHADVMLALVEYFEEDDARLNAIRRIARDDRRKFRGPG